MMRKVLAATMVLVFTVCLGFAWAGPQEDLEKLGGFLFKDKNLSMNQNQSCMTCHHPSAGFVDPENRRNPVDLPVSDGSDPTLFGGRNAPSAAYAGFSPILDQDAEGTWVGGMFWDGRATGWTLDDPLAEQALGPFLNPVEMALLDKAAAVEIVAASRYAELFVKVFPNTDFINFTKVDETYNNIGHAIAAFERSKAVTRFTSKFDKFWKACQQKRIEVSTIDTTTDLATLPDGILTITQLKGLALFNDPFKGNCAACHPTTNHIDVEGTVYPPLFTDFTFDNLGIPINPRVEELSGFGPPDLGLGGFLGDSAEDGKFKVPTLRNVAKTAPYGHNGFFPTLKEIVNFYNTRDVGAWDDPEVSETVNLDELGDLGLTRQEEWAIVVFMRSLTDQR